MSHNGEICSTCLKNNDQLINAEDLGQDNIKWSAKLMFCVPELEWKGSCFLCQPCAHKLQIVYEFRKLCLKSHEIQSRCQGDDVKNEASDDEANNCYSLDVDDCDEEMKRENENDDAFRVSLEEINSIFRMKSKLRDVKNFQCTICHQILDNRRTLFLHIKNSHEITRENFVCYHCNESFSDKAILSDHIQTAHSNYLKTEECQICRSSFSDQTMLENHLILEHRIGEAKPSRKAKEYKCDKCSKIYTTEKIMKIHSVNCNGVVKSEPEILDVKLEKTKLKRGRKPKEKELNNCEICGVIFSTRYLLNRHVRNVHATEKLHNCDICGQKFASPVYLSAHKRYHSRERPHICSFCGKGYITASDLYHHEKIHANKRAYKCLKCPKAFNTSSDLHKHKICVHADRSEWKYVCTFCERRFPLKTNLDTHTKTHTGERNFACHLCDRRCINRSVLLRHIESHSNVRAYRCSICVQDYKYQKSLDIHMAKAHGIGDAKIPERVKKYFCHICPKSYFANNKLQKHIRTHTGERPFACDMCDKRFIDKSYVKQHLKTAHNICAVPP